MSANLLDFNRGAVRPMECISRGWDLIKGQYWLFVGMTFVAVLIGGALPLGILMGPMMCGLYMTLFRRQRGEVVAFELLFKGFDFFVESLIATLLHMAPMLVVIIPTYAVALPIMFAAMPNKRGAEPNLPLFFTAFFIIFTVVLIAALIIGVLFAFIYPLIVERRLSGINAVKTSIKAGMANFGGVLGLMVLTMLLGFVGLLCCYVGIFFVLPVNFAAWSIAYRQIFGEQAAPFAAQNVPPGPPIFS